jgi:outer membrane protein
MNNTLKAALLSIAFCATTLHAASAKENYDWIVRARALYVKPDTKGKAATLGGNVTAGSDQVPELDFTRFFTKNIAAELILATTQNNISLRGSALGENASLGSVNLLPPTLTAQYHFNPEGTFRPYAGAGLNYTVFYGAKSPANTVSKVRYQNHLGYALQVGFDYMIDERFSVNLDVKKIFLKTHAVVTDTSGNNYGANVRLDPWLFGVGLGYRF